MKMFKSIAVLALMAGMAVIPQSYAGSNNGGLKPPQLVKVHKANQPTKGLYPKTTNTQRFNQSAYNSRTIESAKKQTRSIQDQMTLRQALQGHGKVIKPKLDDPRYKHHEKLSHTVKSAKGKVSEVHYLRDVRNGNTVDFKVKHSSEQNNVN